MPNQELNISDRELLIRIDERQQSMDKRLESMEKRMISMSEHSYLMETMKSHDERLDRSRLSSSVKRI